MQLPFPSGEWICKKRWTICCNAVKSVLSGGQAQLCARTRRYSAEEMQTKIDAMLEGWERSVQRSGIS